MQHYTIAAIAIDYFEQHRCRLIVLSENPVTRCGRLDSSRVHLLTF